MSRKLEARASTTPGERVLVQVEVATESLPVLIEGVTVDRVWLEDRGVIAGMQTYSFRADQRLGESRKQPGIPAIDLLTGLMNQLGDALDDEDVPQRLRDLWDSLVDDYEANTTSRGSA